MRDGLPKEKRGAKRYKEINIRLAAGFSPAASDVEDNGAKSSKF